MKNQLFYQEKGISIYNCDSQDLSFIPDESVEIVITSPPYNVGIGYESYNDKMDKEEYLNMIRNVFTQCYLKLRSGGRLAVNVSSCISRTASSRMSFLAYDLHNILKKIGFIERDWICWVKMKDIDGNDIDSSYMYQFCGNKTAWGSWKSPSNPYLRDVVEYILVYNKNDSRLDGDKDKIDITKEEFMKFTSNCWFILPTNKSKSGHPAAFPWEIPYRLMKLYSYVGNTVLDPFAGSGTTGIVAKKLKRNAILCDISEKYCRLMAYEISQADIFSDNFIEY